MEQHGTLVPSPTSTHDHTLNNHNDDDHNDNNIWAQITDQPIDLQKLVDFVSTPAAGAISTFSGTTRDNFQGKKVARLEYEAYVPMAEKEMVKICKRIRAKWDVMKVAMVHRIGVVPIKGSSIVIAISSCHRTDSLQAVQYAIDEVKASVPVWKKEVYEDNTEKWKENSECCFSNKQQQQQQQQ